MFFNDFVDNLKDSINLGSPIKSRLGGIEIDVISNKRITKKNVSTNRRTEKGFNIADNSKLEPVLIDITVVDNSKDYLANRAKFNNLADTGEVTTFFYSNLDEYSDCKIENFTEEDRPGQKFGYTYQITLKLIRTAVLSETDWVINSTPISQNSTTKEGFVANPSDEEAEIVSKRTSLLGRGVW